MGIHRKLGLSALGTVHETVLGLLSAPNWESLIPSLLKFLSGTRIASQNRSDHGGRKPARNHSAAEITGFFASAAAKKSLAASDFGG